MKVIMHYHKKRIVGLKYQDTPESSLPRIRFMLRQEVAFI